MSNSGFSSVGNTLITPSTIQSSVVKLSSGRGTLVADASAGTVNLVKNSEYLLTALDSPCGLVVKNNASNSLLLGADTAVNAAFIQKLPGLHAVGQGVMLQFSFLISGATAQSMANTSGSTSAHVQVALNGAGTSYTQAIKVGGAYAAGSADIALVYVTATNVTSGSEVVLFNVVQQAS